MMLSIPSTLRIRRPSPTTIEYTVSTRPLPCRSYTILLTLTTLLRVLALLAALLLLLSLSYLRLRIPSSAWKTAPALGIDVIPYALYYMVSSRVGLVFQRLASILPLPISFAVVVVITLASLKRPHTTETLLILRGLGVQTSTSSSTYFSGSSSRFIPTAEIQDVLVNEAFLGWEVRYYLVVVVKGEGEVVVVFPKLLPGRKTVEEVWRGGREALWNGKEGGSRSESRSGEGEVNEKEEGES